MCKNSYLENSIGSWAESNFCSGVTQKSEDRQRFEGDW